MSPRSSPLLVEPEQLRTLLVLAERKTFSAAADTLGVQQSAVSHQIRRLEERLARTLFIRGGAGVQPTADGEALIIYAKAMFALDGSLRRLFDEPVPAAILRIGLVEDLTRTALPKVLWLFGREHPAFEFRIVADQPASLIRHVEEGRLDVALVRHHGTLSGVEPLWADRLVWVGRTDILPVSDPVPLVLPPAPSVLRDLVLEALVGAGRTWRLPFEGAGLVSLEAGLRSGLGVGAFPAGMERFDVDELGPEAGLPVLADMHYALLRAPAASDAVGAFCQLFRNAARLSFARSNGAAQHTGPDAAGTRPSGEVPAG